MWFNLKIVSKLQLLNVFFFITWFRIRLSFLLVDLKAIDKICKKNEIFIRKFKIIAGRLTKENKIIKPQALTDRVSKFQLNLKLMI